jgi:hypothetical protein
VAPLVVTFSGSTATLTVVFVPENVALATAGAG